MLALVHDRDSVWLEPRIIKGQIYKLTHLTKQICTDKTKLKNET